MATSVCSDCGGRGVFTLSCDDYCRHCDGTGLEPELVEGDRILYRDDETGEVRRATITECRESGWYEIAEDGLADDTPSIAPELVLGRTGEPQLSPEAVQALIDAVEAVVVPVRKPASRHAHVAEPFRALLNSIGGR